MVMPSATTRPPTSIVKILSLIAWPILGGHSISIPLLTTVRVIPTGLGIISLLLGVLLACETISNVEPSGDTPHYSLTPYSFAPKVGKKLVSNYYTDIGQGLLELMEDMHKNAAPKAAEKKPRQK